MRCHQCHQQHQGTNQKASVNLEVRLVSVTNVIIDFNASLREILTIPSNLKGTRGIAINGC